MNKAKLIVAWMVLSVIISGYVSASGTMTDGRGHIEGSIHLPLEYPK
jgi:hypothetical protein